LFAIVALLTLIVTLLGGVVFFMVRLARRSEATLDPELRDEVASTVSAR
jgi:ATP/ADP translocase